MPAEHDPIETIHTKNLKLLPDIFEQVTTKETQKTKLIQAKSVLMSSLFLHMFRHHRIPYLRQIFIQAFRLWPEPFLSAKIRKTNRTPNFLTLSAELS